MISKWPRISIITPSYNQGQFLEETIRGVLDQGYPNLEYMIIDGGSTDDSVEIIRKYADRLAYWVSEPDRGQSHAINKGFQRATGDILVWLNSDDVYLPGTLHTVGRFFVEHPDVDMVYGDQIEIDEAGQVLRALRSLNFNRWVLLARGMSVSQPASFIRRQVYEQVGGPDEALYWNMDYDYVLRIAFSGHKIKRIAQPLARFRLHSTSKTVTGAVGEGGHWKSMEEIQRRHLAQHPLPAVRLICYAFRTKKVLTNVDRIFKYRRYYWKRVFAGMSDGSPA